MRCQRAIVAAFRKFQVENYDITMSKIIWELPALFIWVPFLIVNKKSEFQVNIFCNDRDI